jgi:hypothetical protein
VTEQPDPEPSSPGAIAGAEMLYAGGWGNLALDGKELSVWKRADGRCVLRETSAHDGDTRHRHAWVTEEQARAEIDAFKARAQEHLAAEERRLKAAAAQPASAGDTATFVGAILGLIAFLALVAWVVARRS